MPTRAPDHVPFEDVLFATGRGAVSLEQKLEFIESLCQHSPQLRQQIDREMLLHHDRAMAGLREAGINIGKLEQLLNQVTALPWVFGDFIEMVDTPQGPRPRVICNGRPTLVTLYPERVKAEDLKRGDEVMLSEKQNLLMARSQQGPSRKGELASFRFRTKDGRLALRQGEQDYVVEPAHALMDVKLQEGDLIRWNRAAGLAYEKIEAPNEGKRYLLDEIEEVSTDSVGGQQQNLRALLSALTATMVDPEKARRYGLSGRRSILMIGPPGCGKTLMARIACSEIARRSGRKCRFSVVKPSEWEDPYVGVTQKNIRQCFAALREASQDGMAVLFLDEVETIGRIRGGAANFHADKFLGAMLAETEGFDRNSNIAIISASNRKDLIDPALLERLSGTEITVNRPDMKGARAIFNIHLPNDMPMNPNHTEAADTRQRIIDTAVSMLYAPNADNELSVLHFRDRSTRTVYAREMISGRFIEQICMCAGQIAYERDIDGGPAGMTVRDIQEAVRASIKKLSTVLSPANALSYLPDLSRDSDVVDVKPITRKVDRPHRYLTQTVA